jgi:hypothetical protein
MGSVCASVPHAAADTRNTPPGSCMHTRTRTLTHCSESWMTSAKKRCPAMLTRRTLRTHAHTQS